ncbi:gamma-glutamylcyclotransferase-like [Galleria mellonella]|uniref:gamma-glutamylcyclotransferase n=1 Tax=Galleria mellonella TaxID=7137 RepID=A0A6J1WSW9_GALME|nr:gamma-glutamylcyclotransferase-like [Galleria mellonella]
MIKSQIYKPDTFLYFSYGANLLTFRVQMHNPSAEFVSIARLDNYRLDFIRYSKFWGGPNVTLVPTANAHVWGVIWRLHKTDMASLDSQEGVDIKKYYIKHLDVLTPYMGLFKCRVYIQKINPLPRGDNDSIPVERLPSRTYKQVMIRGATEHEIPEYYIDYLTKLKDNGEEGCLRMVCLLNRYAVDEPCECRVPGRIPRKPLKLDLKNIPEKKKILGK